MTDEIVHQAPFSDPYATQDAVRGVLLHDRQSDERVNRAAALVWDWMASECHGGGQRGVLCRDAAQQCPVEAIKIEE
jgi:hypothetical protein